MGTEGDGEIEDGGREIGESLGGRDERREMIKEREGEGRKEVSVACYTQQGDGNEVRERMEEGRGRGEFGKNRGQCCM